MNSTIQKIIEENIKLIDENKFDQLFSKIYSYDRADLFKELLKADINPLIHMSRIPDSMFHLGFFGRDDAEPKKIIIPSNIDIKDSLCGQEWYTKDAQLVVEQPFKVIDAQFTRLEVSTLILPNTDMLEKINLGAFKYSYIDKIILSKNIDKSKLLVHTLDKSDLLDKIILQ